MKFDEYQRKAFKTAQYPAKGKNILYPTLGLAGEAGEAVDKIKKLWRNKFVPTFPKDIMPYAVHKDFSKKEEDEIAKELGDVLWYMAAICTELGINMNDVAEMNLAKLAKRAKDGTIKSEGDNR